MTSSIGESAEMYELMRAEGYQCQLLNGKSNHGFDGNPEDDEEVLIERAGEVGMVTISTNMAGRGIDIIPAEEALLLGGLHVILTSSPLDKRVEWQNRGRAGRQGWPGSSSLFVCIETDPVLQLLDEDTKVIFGRAVERFGLEGVEAVQILDFMRRGRRLAQIYDKLIRLQRDKILQDVQRHYFRTVRRIMDQLVEKDPNIGNMKASKWMDNPVNDAFSKKWTAAFSELELIVGNLAMPNVHEPARDAKPKSFGSELANAFKDVFGVALKEIWDLDPEEAPFSTFMRLAYLNCRQYLLARELRFESFDPEVFRDSVRRTVRIMDEMAAEFCDKHGLEI